MHVSITQEDLIIYNLNLYYIDYHNKIISIT